MRPPDDAPRLAEPDPWAVAEAARQDRLATIARLLQGAPPTRVQPPERTKSWLDYLPFATD